LNALLPAILLLGIVLAENVVRAVQLVLVSSIDPSAVFSSSVVVSFHTGLMCV
jgi:hypothetical protein